MLECTAGRLASCRSGGAAGKGDAGLSETNASLVRVARHEGETSRSRDVQIYMKTRTHRRVIGKLQSLLRGEPNKCVVVVVVVGPKTNETKRSQIKFLAYIPTHGWHCY